MKSTLRPFFKGFPKFVSANDEMETREAEETLYFWWWEFVRLSPVLWYAQETGIQPTDPSIANVVASFGDLRGSSFGKWWRTTGTNIFAESKRPPKVKALDLQQLHEYGFDQTKLYIEVPLNIRQQTIVKQFKDILIKMHDGRGLDLSAYSTAQFKLRSKKARLVTLQNEYWVTLYRLLHPNIEVWRIGDRLQLAWQHRVRNDDGVIPNADKGPVNSVTGRFLYKGRFTLLNAERGSFPNADPIELSERHQPFGLKHQTDYRTATQDAKDGTECAYRKWLKEEYSLSLKNKVVRCVNRVEQMKIPGSKVRQRIDAFISGDSDLLA
jgi:hypothetical protein